MAWLAAALLAVLGMGAAARVTGGGGFPWRGVDLSQLGTEDCDGGCPPFRAASGGPRQDALAILRQHGANTFRMRMWNQPCADGRCNASQYDYANLAGVLQMARRCRQANLTFVLDFHYSDWWADPGHQDKPAAWKNLSFAQLAAAVRNFSQATVRQLVAQGTPPAAVQIGNEITNGMLWEEAGQPCAAGGRLWCKGQAPGWARLGRLVAEGIRGVRVACPGCRIAIHTDLGNHIAAGGVGRLVEWYGNLSASLQLPSADGGGGSRREEFDMIGLSMYPQYDDGATFDNIRSLATLAAAFPDKEIYVAETAYPAAGPKQPQKGYPATPTGQAQYLQAVFAALQSALPAAQYAGALWWEGGEHGGYNSLFDEDYVARRAALRGFL